MREDPPYTRAGVAAVVGRANVGKSTLVNKVLGQKVSIATRRPQTTRFRILGVKTQAEGQLVLVDTPGLNPNASRALNQYMNRAALSALNDIDLVVFIVEALRWNEDDDYVLAQLKETKVPIYLVVNKVDLIKDKRRLLPFLDEIAKKGEFEEIIPVSAKTGSNLRVLEEKLLSAMPESPPLYDEEQVTDKSERFLAAELIREKLMARLGEEVPYALTVEIEIFKEKDGIYHIDATIWVEKPGQKKIVIGSQGRILKEIGTQARVDMETLFDRKVYLELWVKVKKGWTDSEKAMQELGYPKE